MLLLPNTLVVSFMAASVQASACEWCRMCLDLKGDQLGEDGDAQAEDGAEMGFSWLTLLAFEKLFPKPTVLALSVHQPAEETMLRHILSVAHRFKPRHLGPHRALFPPLLLSRAA